MKTFSDEALAALERGDAIVSASVEIIPTSAISYSNLGIIDLNSISNAATSATGGLTAGIDLETELSATLSATDVIRISLPTGQTYTAWSEWGVPAHTGFHTGSDNRVNIIPDGVAADMFLKRVTPPGYDGTFGWDGYEAARAAFGRQTFTGASSYIFYLNDSPTGDNSGGLSILVERGIPVATAGAPIRLWGGYGAADLPSDSGTATYQGIGDRGLIGSSSGAIGGSAQNTTLALSGIESAALDVLEPDEVKDASVVVRRLIFDSAGKTLLGSYVYSRGRLDELSTPETVGGGAAIQVSVEGAARGLGRRGGRLRSDADQRLVKSNDGFYRKISFAGEIVLYWGGKRPAVAGSSVSGGGIGGGNVGGGGSLLGLNSSR